MSKFLEQVLNPYRRQVLRFAGASAGAAVLLNWASEFILDGMSAAVTTAQSCPATCTLAAILPVGWQIAKGVIAFLCGLVLVVKYAIPAARGAFLNSSAFMKRNTNAPKSRVLILTLSDLPLTERLRPGQTDEIALARAAAEHALTAKTEAERLKIIDDLCDPGGKWGKAHWRWQQPLRLLRHNYATVDVICFVLTKEAAPQFAALFHPLLLILKRDATVVLPELHSAERDANAINHSDYNDVTKALDKSCQMAMASARCEPSDICIDITSGTKAYSAAATVKTLNSAAIFSYVETSAPFEVVTYDASVSV